MSHVTSYGDSFFTDFYGAFRWDFRVPGASKNWYLVGLNTEFDRMRGIQNSDIHITCVVDDFGNLVRVEA